MHFIGQYVIISSRSCVAVLVSIVLTIGIDFMGFIFILSGLRFFRVIHILKNVGSFRKEDRCTNLFYSLYFLNSIYKYIAMLKNT